MTDPQAYIQPEQCDREMVDWRPIAEAPHDGQIIELTAFDDEGEQFEVHHMRWAHIQRNGLFPGSVGMWTHPSGSYTWNDDGMGGGPTHWRRIATAIRSLKKEDGGNG